MNLINYHEIRETWAPIIESKTSITDQNKINWLSTYCHYHSLNESAGAYNSLGIMNGQGSVAPASNFGQAGGAAGFYSGGSYSGSGLGSGDKFPSLLPLAIQVAAKTIGFDIVPVIPMQGPTGVLSYLDYVYAGGKIGGTSTDATNNYTSNSPDMVKVPISAASPGTNSWTVGSYYLIYPTGVTPGTGTATCKAQYVGNSRIDGFPIFKVTALASGKAISDCVNANSEIKLAGTQDANTMTGTSGSVVFYSGGAAALVKALEDHIQGFTGAGLTNTNVWQGPYVDGTKPYNPMERGTGESTYFKQMALNTFTKFVEAGTFQIAAGVTTEQIQDLSKQFGIDVVSMIENSLVNEVSQAINKHILSRAFALGWSNHYEFNQVEGQNLNINVGIGSGGTSTASYIGKDDASYSLVTPAQIATGGYENQSTVQRRLFSRLLAAANVVANRGRRGPANFVVCNSQIASVLQDISQFTFAPFTNTLTQNNGTLYPVGSIAGMTVYVDQNMQYSDTRVLVGRKGGDDEPGMKFMPYMMAESIQTISEGTMSPKIAVKSRYALVEAGHHPQTMYFTFFVTMPTGGIV